MYVALHQSGGDAMLLSALDDHGAAVGEPERISAAMLPAAVARWEADAPRWVWDDTRRWYAALLAAGVRVERCVDLRLSHAILRHGQVLLGGVSESS